MHVRARPSAVALYGALLAPRVVLLLAQALIGEFPGWRAMVGTALALGGTVYLLFQRGLDISSGPLVGDLLLIVGVIAWAIFTAEGREVVGRFGAFPTVAWTLIAGTVLYLPLGLGALLVPSYRVDIARASAAAWWGVGYLLLMTSV